MAKNNNLKDFLTDVADAIREKKGTTEPINPQNFSSEIASIKSGGGSMSSASKNDVTFYDYEGTILYSYTKEDFLSLNEMPPLPTREGLICQGWNYTMEAAVAYVSKYGVLDVGATYITDDGKTRLHIRIAAKGRMNVPLYFSQTFSNGVIIDWGDGSVLQSISGAGSVGTSHEYYEIGEYTISLNPKSGCTLGLGFNSASYCVMGSIESSGQVYRNMLQSVEIGKGMSSIAFNAFIYCPSLSSITIPNEVVGISTYAFGYCDSLSSIVIPNGVIGIGTYAFYDCYSLSSVVIPESVTSIGSHAFYDCYSLSSITIPIGMTMIDSSVFYDCGSLSSVVIPNDVETINTYAFGYCKSLSSITIPEDVTYIGIGAFYSCAGMAYYDFKDSKVVPTLSSSVSVEGIPSDCKIVVPDSLYNSWINAGNWSVYESQIVKASEFNG